MKKFFILTVAFSAVALMAAETSLWDGNAQAVYTPKTIKTTVENGVLTAIGKSEPAGGKYSYLWPQLNIAPTVFKGKKLSITIEPATTIPGDTIYLKGRTAKGHAFSYVAYSIPAEKKTYVLNIGENSPPFKLFTEKSTGPVDTPVIRLELIMGRKANGTDMQVKFSDIKVLD